MPMRSASPSLATPARRHPRDFADEALSVLRRRLGRPAAELRVLFAVETSHIGPGRFEQGVGDAAATAVCAS